MFIKSGKKIFRTRSSTVLQPWVSWKHKSGISPFFGRSRGSDKGLLLDLFGAVPQSASQNISLVPWDKDHRETLSPLERLRWSDKQRSAVLLGHS